MSPGDATVIRRHASFQALMGNLSEAIAGLRKASELDPLAPFGWKYLADAYTANGQFDLARRALARVAELAPEEDWHNYGLAEIALLEGKPAAALATVTAVKAQEAKPRRLELLAKAHYELGHVAESEDALAAATARFPRHIGVALAVARIYAWRGDRDRAFEWLEKGYSVRDPGLMTLKGPGLRNLHGDPRFTALLKKMNLPLD